MWPTLLKCSRLLRRYRVTRMRHPCLKLLALLLILIQGGLSMARGQSLCMPMSDCSTHEQARAAPCSHHHEASHDEASHDDASRCAHDEPPTTAHAHGVIDPAQHDHPECACHLHVTLPDHDQRPNGASSHVAIYAACFMSLAPDWELASMDAACDRASKPGPTESPPRLELRALDVIVMLV